MKRIIAIILVLSTILSLSGCAVSFDKDAAVDYVKREISDAVDKAVDDAKNQASNAIDDAMADIKEELSSIGDSISQKWNDAKKVYTIRYMVTDGVANVPDTQTVSRIAICSFISKKIPIKTGYRFIGWATSQNATEAAYAPGQIWNAKKSEVLYAIWEECTHKNAKDELYGLNLDTDGEAHCQECHGILPPGLYYFSDYLKVKLPKFLFWQKDYADLNQEELGEAIEGYIKCKGHSCDEVLSYIDEIYSKDSVVLQGFADAHEGIKLVDGYFQLIYQDGDMYDAMVNKDDFWTFYQIKNVTTSIDTFRTIMSAAGTFHSIASFGKTCEKLSQEELEGIANTYHIDMQKIESGIQFAKVAGDAVGLLHSLAGGQTVPGLTPDAEAFKAKIVDLDFAYVSHEIFLSLADINLSTADRNICEQAFKSNGEENIQVQKDRWPNGPTAEETLEYINQLGLKHPSLPNWYFYLGWRIEYECVSIIQMILNDEI